MTASVVGRNRLRVRREALPPHLRVTRSAPTASQPGPVHRGRNPSSRLRCSQPRRRADALRDGRGRATETCRAQLRRWRKREVRRQPDGWAVRRNRTCAKPVRGCAALPGSCGGRPRSVIRRKLERSTDDGLRDESKPADQAVSFLQRVMGPRCAAPGLAASHSFGPLLAPRPRSAPETKDRRPGSAVFRKPASFHRRNRERRWTEPTRH